MLRALAVVLALTAVGPGSAWAIAPGGREPGFGAPSVSATFGPSGEGLLTAHGFAETTPPTWTPTWQACNAAGEACQAFGEGEEIEARGAPAGVRFKALGEGGAFAFSPLWNGPLALRAPPRVRGAVRADELLRPVAAVWSGGWATDIAETGLSACPTPAGGGCVVLAESREGNCQGASVIDPDFAGWYLRMASSVIIPDTAFAETGRGTGYREGGAWRPGPTTAVAALGRIAPARRRRTSSCGPPPLVPGLPPREALDVVHAEIATDGLAIVQ